MRARFITALNILITLIDNENKLFYFAVINQDLLHVYTVIKKEHGENHSHIYVRRLLGLRRMCANFPTG